MKRIPASQMLKRFLLIVTSNPQHIGENSSVMLQSEVHPICIILYRLCGDNVDKNYQAPIHENKYS